MIGAPLLLALPSKGRIREQAEEWFARRGVTVSGADNGREYAGSVEGLGGVELVLMAAGEIPRELAAGRVHAGVTGADLVQERVHDWEARVELLAALGFGRADLVLAVPKAWVDVDTVSDLDAVAGAMRRAGRGPLRVATKYHALARGFLRSRGVADYRLVDSQGATEGVVANQRAEAVIDITTTGATLAANHLKVLEDGLILRSQAYLCLSRAARSRAELSGRIEKLANLAKIREGGSGGG